MVSRRIMTFRQSIGNRKDYHPSVAVIGSSVPSLTRAWDSKAK
jgi:hypothetical protein